MIDAARADVRGLLLLVICGSLCGCIIKNPFDREDAAATGGSGGDPFGGQGGAAGFPGVGGSGFGADARPVDSPRAGGGGGGGGAGGGGGGGGGPDAGGPAPFTEIASGLNFPTAIAVDATHVYWTNRRGGTVMRMPTSGGTPVTLASTQEDPCDIAVLGGRVYWLLCSGPERVRSANLDGSGQTLLARANNSGLAEQFAVDASGVYWNGWDNIEANCFGNILTVPLTGAPGMERFLLGGMSRLVISSHLDAVAVDATHVYFADLCRGKMNISKVPKSGGEAVVLATDQPDTADIALDEGNVYWIGDRRKVVMRVGKGGGVPTTLATLTPTPKRLAIDGTVLFWSAEILSAPSQIGKLLLPMGPAQVHLTGTFAAGGLALDRASVYFSSTGNAPFGRILKAPR